LVIGRSVFILLFANCCLASTFALAQSTDAAVTINADFPGGNVHVLQNQDDSVHLEPDLRGDNRWFYWYFEATAHREGTIQFVLPETVAGFKNGGIGFQGPAISTDAGQTWNWMGTENVQDNVFSYVFSKAGESVRFAVTIPYLQADFEKFIAANRGNAHLKQSVLTRSRNDRPVELIQIGATGKAVQPVLVTGRHHAAESMASFVLEGFLQEAISDSEAGKSFRESYVLFAVPFVDKDGVEAGDQGKNRKPHDHNRDYGDQSIYPEVKAIKALDETHHFRFALDFHCPTLVMEDHQVMYFVGAKTHPQFNFENVSEFAGWIKKGLPADAPVGPLVWLKDESEPAPKNSRYFGFQPDCIMAATFEFPFAPPNKSTDPDSCRKYGQIMLQAWVNTHFQAPETK
jgi:hypothetical protein